MREQDGWDEHAVFMEGLANDEFVTLGGVLADGRAMHVVEAESEEAVRTPLCRGSMAGGGAERGERDAVGDPARLG